MARKQPVVLGSQGYRKVTAASAGDGEGLAKTTSAAGGRHQPDPTKTAHETTAHTHPLKGGCSVCACFFDMRGEEEKKLTADAVLHLASHLRPPERKELLARLSLETQTARVKDSRDLDMWAEALYHALDDAISGQRGVGVGPLPIRRHLAADGNWAATEAFMSASGLAELTVVERMSAYRLLARLVVEHAGYLCRHLGIPLSAKFAAGQCANIASIFDNAFPGYIRAGYARLVVQRQARQGAHDG